MEIKLLNISKHDPDPTQSGESMEFFTLNFFLPGTVHYESHAISFDDELENREDPEAMETYNEKVAAINRMCEKATRVVQEGKFTFYWFD